MLDPVAYINQPRWRTMSLGLERIAELLEGLGNPQSKLRFVHVAGTNGKGSTCAFTASILAEAGYKVGLFTSPYIERFEERIRINGEEITLPELTQVTLAVRDVAEAMENHPTEFELMTAVAFLHFAQQSCDIVVCEVGLGGKLDSTNIIDAPEVCAFAPISFDHCAMLGSTLKEIAGEKAGIIKPGCLCVSAPQEPESRQVLEARAAECVAPIHFVEEAEIFGNNEDFSFGGLEHLSVALQGLYQRTNAAVAISICQALQQKGWKIPTQAIFAGLAAASWPGRFEFLRRNPDVVVDGAHNYHAIRALGKELRQRYAPGSVVFAVGVMADKDYAPMLEFLAPLASAFVCYAPENPRALSAAQLAQAVQFAVDAAQIEVHPQVVEAPSAEGAVNVALQLAQGKLPICFCGSLYGIGAIKEAWRAQ